MGTKYDNADWSKCARTYKTTIVVIDDDNVAQGNMGVSLPCKGCYVQMREVDPTILLSIGTPAADGVGVQLGLSDGRATPLWVPVSDVAQLYFYGEPFDIVDIMYFIG